jgi:NTP pyrophosphatase (non-canonical NTP hydrolase)
MTILYTHLTRDEDIYLSLAASDILDHYGPGHQYLKLAEECSELSAVIARCANDGANGGNDDHLREELADVILVLEQVVASLNAEDGRKLAQMVMYKADRQLRRISKEKEKEEESHAE